MTAAVRRGSFWEEYPPADVLIAAGASALLLVSCAILLKAPRSQAEPRAPAVEAPAAVKVVPVLDMDAPDMPLLKLGGKPDSSRLPDRSVKQSAKARAERKAQVSSAADKSLDAIPPPDVPVAEEPSAPPPPDAEITNKVDTPVAPTSQPAAPSNVPTVGHSDGAADGTETDPLKARAVDLYRARIVAWFSSRFRVSGSGLGEEELLKLRASATVEIGAGRVVGDYTLSPSGNAAFDAAARSALGGAKGLTLPPPPESYPDVVQSRIRLTFVCKEHRCD